MKKIAVGCDARGQRLEAAVVEHLIKRGEQVVHVANDASLPYYTVAATAAAMVSEGEVDCAILVCGSGMGMAIVANKFPGVYAAVCENSAAAQRSRSINNSNVLTLGEFVTGSEEAWKIVDTWLDTEFTAGWPPDVCEFLRNSMGEIEAIERKTAARLVPSVPAHALVITTVPSVSAADALARRIVEQRLSACVQITKPVQSVYRWNDVVQDSEELQVLVKTTSEQVPAVIAYIKANHTYDLPEIITVPITGGSAAYLRWVSAMSRKDGASK